MRKYKSQAYSLIILVVRMPVDEHGQRYRGLNKMSEEERQALFLDDYSLTIIDLEPGPKEKLKGTLENQKSVRISREDPRRRIR